jgi:hypothetical protein
MSAILNLILTVVGIVAVPAAGWLANRCIAAFESRTHIQLTEQQRQTVLAAAHTAAGALVVELSKGRLGLGDIHPASDIVKAQAATAINAVPEASAALRVSTADLAQIIVGKIGAMIAADPTVATVPAQTQAITPTISRGAAA